jgi:hypothetical protein
MVCGVPHCDQEKNYLRWNERVSSQTLQVNTVLSDFSHNIHMLTLHLRILQAPSPEDGGSIFLRNIGTHVQFHAEDYHKNLTSHMIVQGIP